MGSVIGLIALAGAFSVVSADEGEQESARRVGELVARYDFFADADQMTFDMIDAHRLQFLCERIEVRLQQRGIALPLQI